jgi:hypothetical protein
MKTEELRMTAEAPLQPQHAPIMMRIRKHTNTADNTHDPPTGIIVDAPRRDVHDVDWRQKPSLSINQAGMSIALVNRRS